MQYGIEIKRTVLDLRHFGCCWVCGLVKAEEEGVVGRLSKRGEMVGGAGLAIQKISRGSGRWVEISQKTKIVP